MGITVSFYFSVHNTIFLKMADGVSIVDRVDREVNRVDEVFFHTFFMAIVRGYTCSIRSFLLFPVLGLFVYYCCIQKVRIKRVVTISFDLSFTNNNAATPTIQNLQSRYKFLGGRTYS